MQSTYPPRSVILICGDPRLADRDRALFVYYTAVDGIEPFRAILPGACLLFGNFGVLNDVAGTYIDKGARHFHAEDHMGIDDETPGCAAYARRYSSITPGSPFTTELEYESHFAELHSLPENLRRVALNENAGGITINTGIFRHNDAGFGVLEPMLTERELPPMHEVLTGGFLQTTGSRPS